MDHTERESEIEWEIVRKSVWDKKRVCEREKDRWNVWNLINWSKVDRYFFPGDLITKNDVFVNEFLSFYFARISVIADSLFDSSSMKYTKWEVFFY